MGQVIEKRSPILVPPCDFDVLEHLGKDFEVVYGILHPFEQIAPENQDIIDVTWEADLNNPYLGTALECFASGEGPNWVHYQTLIHHFLWRDIITMMKFPSLNYLNRLLQECCGARRREHDEAIDRMFATMKPLGIDRPSEGDFPPLLLNDFLRSFLDLGETSVCLTTEFGETSKVFTVENLLEQRLTSLRKIQHSPTLHTEDYRLFYGVHWDSMFTFLCGSRSEVETIVEKYQFEGFFFQPGMTLCWEDDSIVMT